MMLILGMFVHCFGAVNKTVCIATKASYSVWFCGSIFVTVNAVHYVVRVGEWVVSAHLLMMPWHCMACQLCYSMCI